MTADFLLELRSEEIPARMQAGARINLEYAFLSETSKRGLHIGEPAKQHDFIVVYSTPRRLALLATGVPLATSATTEEFKGPRTNAPEQALAGFLRKVGLSRDELVERDGVWFANVTKPGRDAKEILAEVIESIVRTLPWPKSQRWGADSLSSESLRWVRPLSGIIALLGGDVVPCEIGGIVSGRETIGHRFHHSGVITIDGVEDYAPKLRAAHVIVDHAEREAIVRDGAARAAADAGLVLVEDEGLVIENAGLTEWPVPLLGRFDAAFLTVPPEVIQLTARVNQKYFICRDAAGTLANAFICTANIAAHDGGAAIIDGNRKVLAARLSDARFFWEQDQKTPLAEQAKKLARITFHEKLGSLAEKVARVADLAEWLATEGIVPGADPALARQAAELCKADLVTEMVGEFPELQGLMGGYYARVEGLPAAVADAIRDHYKPVGQGDDVPFAPVTIAVALADKLDTLRSFFAIDEKPTGSKDPFALRRAALGVIRLITDNGLRLGLAQGELLAFFADRLKVQQREAGVPYDLIDAVFAGGDEDDLVRLLARVHALQAFVGTEDGANLLAGYKRAANILKKETGGNISRNAASALLLVEAGQEKSRISIEYEYESEPAEAALAAALDGVGRGVDAALGQEDFVGALAALATLRAPIDAFFDAVTVNDADANKRANRLALLDLFRAAVHKVADFSRIEG